MKAIDKKNTLQGLFKTALFYFMLAGLTGFLFRLSMVWPLPFNLDLVNIRHAHSHLMFFGWAIPVPMLFIVRFLSRNAHIQVTAFKRNIGAIFILGLTAYPFFLLYGYHPVPLPGKALPVAAMLSGIIMLGWYTFMGFYLRARKKVTPSAALSFYDAALLMLAVSSLGAWGISMTQILGLHNALIAKSLTHFFLTTFTEGWCVLSVLGLLFEHLDIKASINVNTTRLIAPIALGVPLMFPFGISADLLTPQLLWTARIGGLLVATGLILTLNELRKHLLTKMLWTWRWPLGFLGLKIGMQLVACLVPAAFWMGRPALRILYLHTLLLGFFTTGLFTGIYQINKNLPKSAYNLVMASVIILVGSLVPLTRFWPLSWSGGWVFEMVAVVALLPVLAVSWSVFQLIRTSNQKPELVNFRDRLN